MRYNNFSRRVFLRRCTGYGTALWGSGFLLVGCGTGEQKGKTDKKEKPVAPADPCNNFEGVSADELEKRRKLGYADQSQVPEASCSNCGLYIPFTDVDAAQCGKCLLFKGPVRAEGHCLQYVPKTS
ncbi:hypothetical protein [Agriterribacter sp.]|uniref:hypothetical protein n=1 Tax=Agriterribacter sp. TaxID=2821509 RepID=UPI002CE19905|nr:hypothetical protein [Agriterribacter sp.]HRP57115.1 hypothetical protein [Agriterribacter sp.]